MIVDLTDNDLLSKMRNFEDHFVERKVFSDQKDWVKTVVAFANSAPDGFPCVLYIGVKDNGEIETRQPQTNLDRMQKNFNVEMKKIYPPPAYLPKIIEEDGRQALAIIVLGSELRPHFAGPSYIRKGSETCVASEEQFIELIARRNSKANKILSFKGKNVTVYHRYNAVSGIGEHELHGNWNIAECNQFWLTLAEEGTENRLSFPLNQVEISFDDQKQRLRLEINQIF